MQVLALSHLQQVLRELIRLPTLSAPTGCAAFTTTTSVTINALPTITGTLNACIGATTQLTGSGTPAASNPWTSSNTGIATISSTGLVTGVSAGTVTITYQDNNGCSRTASVTINTLPTITGTLSACVGATTQLTGSATAAATTPWTSSNTGVATVSNTGLVTGVTAGTTTITYRNTMDVQLQPLLPSMLYPLILCTGIFMLCVAATTRINWLRHAGSFKSMDFIEYFSSNCIIYR